MKELLVLSGKGGTGKTSITASFAVLAENKVMVDCDVDAANLHLLLSADNTKEVEFYGLKKANIDPERCNNCGLCEELCRYGAIENSKVVEFLCEGCGLCAVACPKEAIIMQDNLSGHWYTSVTEYGPMVHARLGIAEENSGMLVSEIRKASKSLAKYMDIPLIITDGPPGIGCPVIAALTGVDMVIIVTEPTVSGIHDLKRVFELTQHFEIPTFVCINKYDLNQEKTVEIEEYCTKQKIRTIGKIPFDRAFSESIIKAKPLVGWYSGESARRIKEMWEDAQKILWEEVR